MNRIFGIIVVLMTLSACGGSGGGEGNETVSASLSGGWGFIYQENSCRESFHFFENGSMEINSAREIVLGTYTFEETVGRNQRHELVINLLSGNNEPDCLGNRTSESGLTGIFYVEFDSSTEISWYEEPNGGAALLTLNSITDIPFSRPPSLNFGDDLLAYERETVQLTAETDAPEGSSYLWEQISGPTVSVQGANSKDAEIVLPSIDTDTSLVFDFTIMLEGGSTYSDQVEVIVLAYTHLSDIEFADQALSGCVAEISSGTSLVDVTEVSSLHCENVSDISGIEQLAYLTSLSLSDNSVTSLTPLFGLSSLEQLDLSGNPSLFCEQIEAIESTLPVLVNFVKDDLCIANRGVELGAIGFDAVIDEDRNQIYVSIPTRNEIAVVSTTRMRVVDRILLGGEPYGIDLSIDHASLYVAVRGTDSVAVIDLDSRVVSSIPLANQTGHSDLYDVIEAAPGRVFVSSSPGSGGFAYIAQIDLNQSNVVTRAADARIIRASPTFARSPDYDSLYVSEGFSPNSLYKLNLLDPDAPVVLEDDHGSISGTYNMSVNSSGSRIAVASGQVLRTGSFIESGRVAAGLSVPGLIDNNLYVLSNNSGLNVFDFDTLEQMDSVTSSCNFGTTRRIGIFDNNDSAMFLQQDVLCIKKQISQSAEPDPYPLLTFEDLGFEKCVIAAAEANGYTSPSEFEELDCSAAEKNIISLNSIDKLVNLRNLDISGHSVFSTEPLGGLSNLESITIQDSIVSSLSSLNGLAALAEIDAIGSEKIPCDDLTGFQLSGIIVTADFCTENTRIELGGLGSDMEYKASTNKLYVSIPSMGQVTEIDIDGKAISNNYPIGGEVQRIDLSSDGETLYSTLYGDGDIAYLELDTGNVEVVDLSMELDDDRAWDIAEVSPDRIVVSSNPGSNGFAYIVEVRRDLGNVATRVADQRIIRASPEFAVAENGSSVYVGEGFSPNSLYKLDATVADMPLVLEDNHGNVSGTSHLTLNSSNTMIYLASGQVLSTTNFSQVAKFNAGRSWLSEDELSLYIADGESNAVGEYDTSTRAKIGRYEFGCDVTSIQALQEIPDVGISVLGDDLVCFTRVVSFN